MKRLVDWSAITLLILGLLWAWVPSSFFVKTIALSYDVERQTFTLTREVNPFLQIKNDDVNGHVGRWWSEIILIDGEAFECQSENVRNAFYQQVSGNTVRYKLDIWAAECLDSGPPFYVIQHRQVMLFGWLPLRPDVSYSEIQRETQPRP